MPDDRTPPFRAEHVGSLLRPRELKDAFRDFHDKRIDEAVFRVIQDRCIREAVALQEDVGLQSITDGEFRRGSWFAGFVDAVEGLTTRAAAFDFRDSAGGSAKFETAYVAASCGGGAVSRRMNSRSSAALPSAHRRSRCRRRASFTFCAATRPSMPPSIPISTRSGPT